METKKITGLATVIFVTILLVPTFAHANMVLPAFLIMPLSLVARPVPKLDGLR